MYWPQPCITLMATTQMMRLIMTFLQNSVVTVTLVVVIGSCNYITTKPSTKPQHSTR